MAIGVYPNPLVTKNGDMAKVMVTDIAISKLAIDTTHIPVGILEKLNLFIIDIKNE
jgi:hypothetical protein